MKKIFFGAIFFSIFFIASSVFASETTYRFAFEIYQAQYPGVSVGFFIKDFPVETNKINVYISNNNFSNPDSASALAPYLKNSITNLPSASACATVECPFSYYWNSYNNKSAPGQYYIMVAVLKDNNILNHSEIQTINTQEASNTAKEKNPDVVQVEKDNTSKAVAAPLKASVAAAPGTPSIPSPALSCPAKQVPTELGCVSSFGQYFSIILDWLVPAVSAVAGLMAVYAGILYMTSMGNTENIEKAKTIIFSVIFGVGLLFLLEIIVRLLGIQT